MKLRLGLVGLGAHTYNVPYPTMKNMPVELVAARDVSAASLARFAAFYHVPERSRPAPSRTPWEP